MKWLTSLKEVLGFDPTKNETSETSVETVTYDQKVELAKARLGTKYLLHPVNRIQRKTGSNHRSAVLSDVR